MFEVMLKSSAIEKVCYDEVGKVLTVTFHSGGSYDYPDVPKEKFEGLVNADSCGRYFHKHIRQYSKIS